MSSSSKKFSYHNLESWIISHVMISFCTWKNIYMKTAKSLGTFVSQAFLLVLVKNVYICWTLCRSQSSFFFQLKFTFLFNHRQMFTFSVPSRFVFLDSCSSSGQNTYLIIALISARNLHKSNSSQKLCAVWGDRLFVII